MLKDKVKLLVLSGVLSLMVSVHAGPSYIDVLLKIMTLASLLYNMEDSIETERKISTVSLKLA